MDNLDRMPEPEEPRLPPIEYRDKGRLVLTFVTAFVGSAAGKIVVGVVTAAVAAVLLWHHKHSKAMLPAAPQAQVTHLTGKVHPTHHKHGATKTVSHATSKKKAKSTKSKKKSTKDKNQTSSYSSRAQNG